METKKRITIIDQIRGFAMFGVLLVNLTMMEDPLQMHTVQVTGTFNIFFEKLIDYFAVGKFYTMFSILFGLGFYFFMEKHGDRLRNEKLFKRRLYFLLGIGLLHAIFGWSGDILHVYAVGGFFLIKKQNLSLKTLLKQGLGLFLFSIVLITGLSILSLGNSPAPIPVMTSYDETQYLNVVMNRLMNEIPYVIVNLIFVLPRIISLFILGYTLGKSEMLKDVEGNLLKIKTAFKYSGLLFLCLTVSRIIFSKMFLINILAKELSTLAGAITYGSALILISVEPIGRKLLMLLTAPGKMALTNYLVQTLFWTTVLYGYGADFGGKIPYAMYLPLAIGFYSTQILCTNIWMRHFKQGPMEALWRFFTYRALEKSP